MCMSICAGVQVPGEASRGRWITWRWSYRQLSTTSGFSGRAVFTLFFIILFILCIFYIMCLDPIHFIVPLNLPSTPEHIPNKTKLKRKRIKEKYIKREKLKKAVVEAAL